MKLIYVSLVVLVCVVIEIKSQRIRSGMCKGCQHEEYTRIKRAKYYSSPPLKFYNKPPVSYPFKGPFSYTPPPGYLTDDSRQNKNLKTKVSSSRPANEGMGDDDINNIMKFLSKQDLDKIVEFANERERYPPKNTEPLYEKPNYIGNNAEKYESKVIYNSNVLELDNDNQFSAYSDEYNNPHVNELKETKPFKYLDLEPSALFINKNNVELNIQDDSDRVMKNQQFSNLNAYVHQQANGDRNSANIFSDSTVLQEEQLPKPSNLRDDFEVSYTNNVATVVKANSNSYKIENLGALPLMNYHSKMYSVDSYRVPHYTVTSSEKHRAPASSAKISVEPAPPASTAQQQSDAHLKAIKIWTHKSKGTAYTLHDDGTLSLERPSRPKTNYDP